MRKLGRVFVLALMLVTFLMTATFQKVSAVAHSCADGEIVLTGNNGDTNQNCDCDGNRKVCNDKCEPPSSPNYCATESLNSNSIIPEVQGLNQNVSAAIAANSVNEGLDVKNRFIFFVAQAECFVSGNSAQDCVGSPSFAPTSTAHVDRGPYGALVGYISDMYKYQPANTDRYVADLMQDMHIGITGAKPVYAQGLGFASLDPILSVWKIFRNIAYMGFIVVFLIIGFMIMFRQKIGSQAVVTAQQAIPNIVVALLAVTFSYAIAGLLIDAMYLIMYFMMAMFTETVHADLINMNFVGLAQHLINGGIASSGATEVGNFIDSALGGGAVSTIASWLANITAAIIIWIVILYNAFKLFFNLLKIYVDIILNIAFAPVTLMAGAIPGKSTFGPWLQNLVADLAVFPGIMVLLIIFSVLQDTVKKSGAGGAFSPPYMSGTGLGAGTLPFLAGLALIMALPTAVDEIKKALGGSSGGLFGTLINTGLKNMGNAAPIATGIVGGLTGAGIGAGIGLGNGILNTRGTRDRGVRAERILEYTGRGIGNLVGRGANLGIGLGSRAGSSPGVLAPVEKFVKDYAGYGSDEQRLKRLANPGSIFDPARQKTETFETKFIMAQAERERKIQANKRQKDRDYGELIAKGTPAKKTP